MITPRDEIRKRIAERNRYSPVSEELAHRGRVPGWKGYCQPTVKQEGDMVLPTGVSNGNSRGTPGS